MAVQQRQGVASNDEQAAIAFEENAEITSRLVEVRTRLTDKDKTDKDLLATAEAYINQSRTDTPALKAAKLRNATAIIKKVSDKHPVQGLPIAQQAPPSGGIGVNAPTGGVKRGGGSLSVEDTILSSLLVINGIDPAVVLLIMQGKVGASGGYSIPARIRTYRRRAGSMKASL
jgi:hypothetical protein